jgi:hypothetical protein
MVKVTKVNGTVVEITNTGSVLVEADDSLTQYVMITSDFPAMPRLNQRVTLETAFGHTKVVS